MIFAGCCWPMGGTCDTCLDGDTLSAHLAPRVTHCHGPTSKNFLPPGPAKWFLHPWRLLTPLPSHELWQYPDIIYLTKANNRSTLQSNWESERGTREFNNWFNASPHIKAKDFAKRWGQKQPVHFIICQTAPAPDVRNEKFLTKRAKLLSALSSEVRAGERVETRQFRIPRLLVLNVCKFASFWFLGSKVLATNTLWHPLKLSAMLLTFPVWGGGAIVVSW